MGGARPAFWSAARRRLVAASLALSLVLLAAAACTNDINPSGGWSAPAAGDGYLYLGTGRSGAKSSSGGNFIRIDANTGRLDSGWQYPAGKGTLGAIYGTPLVKDGVIYGAGYTCRGNICSAEVAAVETATGNPVWAEGGYSVATKISGHLAAGSAVIVFGTAQVGTRDGTPGYLYALDPEQDAGKALLDRVSARLSWRLPVDGAVVSGPMVVDDVAYFGTMSRTLYAVDLKDEARYRDDVPARILWSFKSEGAITATPLVSDGMVYFGDFQNQLYALNANSRRLGRTGPVATAEGEWQFEAKAWFWAQPVTEGGVIYAATLGGQVYALDAKTGRPGWPGPAEVEGQVIGAPVFVDTQRGRALAVPSTKKDVVLIKLTDGSVEGSLFTGGSVKSSPFVSGDFIFVHALNGNFYTFSAKSLEERSCVQTHGKEAGVRCKS